MSSSQETEVTERASGVAAWFSQVSDAISSAFLSMGAGSSSPAEGGGVGLSNTPCNSDPSTTNTQGCLDALGLSEEEDAERTSTIPLDDDQGSVLQCLEGSRDSPMPSQSSAYGYHQDGDVSSTSESENEHAKLVEVSTWVDNLRVSHGGEDAELTSLASEASHMLPVGPDRSLTPSLSGQATEDNSEGETPPPGNDHADNSSTDIPETQEQVTGEESSSTPPPSTSQPISKCGDLILVLEYKANSQKLVVTVVVAQQLPDKERSGVDAWQVHIMLLPSKKQRHKTAVQRSNPPRFAETFRFTQLDPTEISGSALRFRLYGVGKMSREHMMGEGLLHLAGLNLQGEMEVSLVLEPQSNMEMLDSQSNLPALPNSISSTQSLSHGGVPELLIGLCYSATTGRLSVELIKGSHFRNLAENKPPDTYGKLTLLDLAGQEISRCKTSVRRGQPHPVYKETFVFQVALFQLCEVTLLVSVQRRRSMNRREMVGWVSLGQQSSGQEEQLHWQDMQDSMGQQVSRWHVLLES